MPTRSQLLDDIPPPSSRQTATDRVISQPLTGHARYAASDVRTACEVLSRCLAVDGMQLGSDAPNAPIRARSAAVRRVRLVALENESTLTRRCELRESAYLVEVVIAGTARHSIGVRQLAVQPGAAVVYGPGALLRIANAPGSSTLAVQFERRDLEQRLAHMLQRPIREPLAFAERLDLHVAASFWRALNWICDEIDRDDSILCRAETIASEAETLLMDMLLANHTHNYSAALAGKGAVAVPRHLRAVLSAIERAPQESWPLARMATVGGVSVRTLCEAFRRFRGCTPMEFLRSTRLIRIRADLHRPGARTSIADAARRWGFGHPGRFAAAYRKTFGETPSQSLRFGVCADEIAPPSAG